MHVLLQALLGALVASTWKNRLSARWLWLAGAGIGMVPDLDALTFLVRPALQADGLRSTMTHSFAFALVLGLLTGWVVSRWKPAEFGNWTRMAASVVIGHLILDTCSIQGAAWLSPFYEKRFSWAILPHFEPVLALILALGLGVLLMLRHNWHKLAAQLVMVAATGWVLLAVANKSAVHARMENAFHRQGVSVFNHETYPTPGNTLLFTEIGRSYTTLYVGEATAWNPDLPISFAEYPLMQDSLPAADVALIALVTPVWAAFQQKDTLQIADLRYGVADTLKPSRHFYKAYSRTSQDPAWISTGMPAPWWPVPGSAYARRVFGEK